MAEAESVEAFHRSLSYSSSNSLARLARAFVRVHCIRVWGQISTFNNWFRPGVEFLLIIPGTWTKGTRVTSPLATIGIDRVWSSSGRDIPRDESSRNDELESAKAKADRLIAEGLARLRWTQDDLAAHRKSDPSKLAMAARLRRETTLTVRRITGKL